MKMHGPTNPKSVLHVQNYVTVTTIRNFNLRGRDNIIRLLRLMYNSVLRNYIRIIYWTACVAGTENTSL